MTFSGQVSKPLRVLVSEGNSTSAREAVTILGLSGQLVEICDPSPYCLARFSRFVRKFHRCPGMRDNPGGFLTFVERLLARRHFDVLLPIHEQGFLFARVHARLADRVGLALPSFADYRSLHNKAGLSRLLGDLHLPQPATHIVSSENEARAAARFPCVVKTSVGTASQGIWFVHNDGDLNEALRELSARALSKTKYWCRNLSLARPRRRKPCFAAANWSDRMPIDSSLPVLAAARRSRRASIGRKYVPRWR